MYGEHTSARPVLPSRSGAGVCVNPIGALPKILERSWAPAPLWHVERQELPKIVSSNMSCDTVVVGAGVIGLSIGYSLSQTQKIVVLDARRIGEGSSGWNAGILSVDTTIDLRVLESVFGEEQAQELVTALAKVLQATKNKLALDDSLWQSGSSLYLAAKHSHEQNLKNELAIRNKYSLPTKMLTAKELSTTWRGFCAAIEFQREHAVHPVALLLTMARSIGQRGGAVLEDSPVHSWEHTGKGFVVHCGNGFTVQAKNLVLSTGLSSAEFGESSELSKLLIPVTAHAIVTEPSEYFAEFVARGGPIALWDSLQLYHYVRYLPDGRVLMGGEETPGVVPGTVLKATDPHIQKLYQWAQQHHTVDLPPIQHCWKASLVVPADGLPMIKVRRINDSFLVSAVTDGLPFGMLLGSIISYTLSTGQEEQLEQLLSYRRRPALSARLLSWLPSAKPVRAFAHMVAFAALKLQDRLW